jgi:hypothetical protein
MVVCKIQTPFKKCMNHYCWYITLDAPSRDTDTVWCNVMSFILSYNNTVLNSNNNPVGHEKVDHRAERARESKRERERERARERDWMETVQDAVVGVITCW